MKKFLKVFIIFLLVVAAVGGTCFVFFRNIKKNEYKTPSFAQMLKSESKLKFDNDLTNMSNVVNSDLTDDRLSLICKTNNNLNNIVYILSTYFIDTNTTLNDKEILNATNQVSASRNLLVDMMKEYNVKKDSAFFDRHLGANDFYKQASVYLIRYANLATLLNNYVDDVDKNADIKFNMFEIYSNVVASTFNKIEADSENRLVVKDRLNIDLLNNVLILEDSYIKTSCEKFSVYTNYFNKYYNLSNKANFVKDLQINLSSVTENETENEKLATYYFKVVYGI